MPHSPGAVSVGLLPAVAAVHRVAPFSRKGRRETSSAIVVPLPMNPSQAVSGGSWDTHPDHARLDLGDGFVLGQRNVGGERRVAGDARVGVAEDVGLPLPAGRVRVPCADVLGLQALEFLLRAELVGLRGGSRGEKMLAEIFCPAADAWVVNSERHLP